ncbi:MAG: phosphate acyltransferase PlsX [Pseudomonadota bacterium]|nr:phosphate acyltransferase PlsX [Gammaproteobacteria bacterium]MBU1559070.1 phosphate acyltransferase PlsX [Gammaproteobacteria bacterium]MBU1926321.1 phosphate acyltransferase PlsX [Gammaproteobacteria bacterium]MBU2546235.1 phosphate acyltransferase PlsX [Gammaproteobacteria bacterium]
MSKINIAIDAMGGDNGAQIVVPASINALKKHPNLHLILVGDQAVLQPYVDHLDPELAGRLTCRHASQVVEMDESPSQSLRYKKDSSMRVAINLVKAGEAQACVSAGNTGALMATAHFVLKTLSGVDRPAILGVLPTQNPSKCVHILDLGANVDSSPKALFQFAVMGSVLARAVDGIENPKVALLNIGVEDIKGNELVKQTAQLLSGSQQINYVGYVEGDEIFKGRADVIVCDGFVGNVALKTIEGEAKFITKIIKEAFRKNFWTRLVALFALFALRTIKKRLNPDLYNGASFLGLRGIVIKSHGRTTVKGFEQAIENALQEVDHNVPELIEETVAELLKAGAENK